MNTAPPSRRRLFVLLGALGGGLLAVLGLAAVLGVDAVDWNNVLRVDSVDYAIVWHARLGRAALGAVVGAALASAGVTFQTLVRNPLADPYILGVSSGASVGAAVAILLHLPLTPLAFAGAMGATAIVYRLGMVRGRLAPHVALLSGVVLGAFAWAVIVTLATLARPGTTAEMLIWLMGSLSAPEAWPLALTTLLVALGVVGLVILAPRMNALALGDEGAHSLGVNVPRTQSMLLLLASLLTAVAVTAAGPIGFVGIIVPHFVRLLTGSDHRLLVPASALAGAVFLALCDSLTRVAFLALGSEAPVSVLTALLGGPFFLVLLWRRRSDKFF